MKNIDKQIQIEATPEKVWQVVGNVGEVAAWVPAIESSAMEDDIRHAVFVGGDKARERILSRDEASRTYTYRYLDGPLPLKVYESTITVHPEGEGARVVWTAEFAAEDPSTEDVVAETIDGIYTAGLDELGKRFGG